MVAVLVVAGEAAELVPGQLAGLAVVVRGLLPGGGAGEWPELQQRARCLGAVEVPVADDRALVGALRAAVVRVQVLDELRPGGAQRDGPGVRVAVGVAAVIEDVAESGMPAAGMAVRTGTRARAGSRRQEHRVMRRASSGTSAPFSSRSMVPAEK